MKNALILHGTGGSSKGNWFPWLKTKLEERGYKVAVPDLPGSDAPNIKRYNEFLLSQGFEYNEETVVIGHSSGAVEILGLLQALPEGTKIKAAIFVGAFMDDLGRDDLKGLFEEPFDFEKIETRADKFIFIHSDDDPLCPLEGAQFLSDMLDAELIVQTGQQHYSIGKGGSQFKEFPFILEVIERL